MSISNTVRPASGPKIEAAQVVQLGLMRVVDAAEFLGISRASLYRLMDVGEIRFVLFGRSRRIPRQELINAAARCLRGGVQ
jgi:excisionase family DNA binding protein